jgi:hypothetical protein
MVGQLAGPPAHDYVAQFGWHSKHQGGLSVVANTHLYDWGTAYAKGETDPIPSQARVIGILRRDNQFQWRLSTAAGNNTINQSDLWDLSFQQPQAWPYTGGDYANAMSYIINQVPDLNCTNPRAQYSTGGQTGWGDVAALVAGVQYPTAPYPPALCPQGYSHNFTSQEFGAVRQQLVTEMAYVDQIRAGIIAWNQIFSNAASDQYVQLKSFANTILNNVLNNSARNRGVSVDALKVLGYATSVGASLAGVGNPVAGGVLGAVSAGFFLADSVTPSSSNEGNPSFDTQELNDRAYAIATDLANRYSNLKNTLLHLGDVLVGDWGKLEVAGPRFSPVAPKDKPSWALTTKTEKLTQQSLAVAGKRVFNQAMLPLAFTEWVVAPPLISPNQNGPGDPFQYYYCFNDAGTVDQWYYQQPFRGTPLSAMDNVLYRPQLGPDSNTWPAQPNTTYWIGRVLVSSYNHLETNNNYDVNTQDVTGNAITSGGRPPPASLTDPLTMPVSATDSTSDPKYLGMQKEDLLAPLNWSKKELLCNS